MKLIQIAILFAPFMAAVLATVSITIHSATPLEN
jgi:hypothetical protein